MADKANKTKPKAEFFARPFFQVVNLRFPFPLYLLPSLNVSGDWPCEAALNARVKVVWLGRGPRVLVQYWYP